MPTSRNDRDDAEDRRASAQSSSTRPGGEPRPGQILFGRYLVLRQLGEGGMGSVWLVRHLELDAERALKLIVSGTAFDPQVCARFEREARVIARLSHPNAVVVHDAGMGKDAAFIEMEYIRGQSLNKLLQAGVPMPLDWTARILEQLCDVLQAAHNLKIVHRDLKPANLMLVKGWSAGKELLKVLDFGIAKLLEAELTAGDVQTRPGCFLGSAEWSSPEQASDGHVDARSDLYAVGVILYEFLTGHRPFSGPLPKVLYDHLYTPPPPFAAKDAARTSASARRVCRGLTEVFRRMWLIPPKSPQVAVPPAIERVVLRCLASAPTTVPSAPARCTRNSRRCCARGRWSPPGFGPPLPPGPPRSRPSRPAGTYPRPPRPPRPWSPRPSPLRPPGRRPSPRCRAPGCASKPIGCDDRARAAWQDRSDPSLASAPSGDSAWPQAPPHAPGPCGFDRQDRLVPGRSEPRLAVN